MFASSRLIALCTPNCKSLWIKASAKWLNVNVDINTPPHLLSYFLSSPLQGQFKTSCVQFSSQSMHWHQAGKHTSALEFIKGRDSLESQPQHLTRHTLSLHFTRYFSPRWGWHFDTYPEKRRHIKEKARKEKQTAYWPFSSWWKLTLWLSLMMTLMVTNRPTYGSKGSLCTSVQWRQLVQNEPCCRL